jgi:DNA-binding transcriptional LysR family regulator
MGKAMQWVDRIGCRLKLRDVHILMAVAQSGSMAKAARDLAVSQPVVSKTIADLEHTLGVRLLDRNPQGVTPTPYGQALLHRSVAAFDELRQGVKEIESLSDPTVGEVRIGATNALAEGLLPAVIAQHWRQHPRLTVHVTQGPNSVILLQHLRERTIDFIIGRIPNLSAEKELAVEELFEEPQFVVVGSTNPLLRRRNLRLADLIDKPWVLPPVESMAGALVADVFRAEGLALPQAAVWCGSLQMTSALLTTGPFLGMFPRSLFTFDPKRHAVKALSAKLPKLPRPVGLVTLRTRTLSPAARLFIHCIREIAKPLAKAR